MTIDKTVTYLNNAGASNWDKELVKANLKEMQTKDIINENYKPLVTLPSDSPDFSNKKCNNEPDRSDSHI